MSWQSHTVAVWRRYDNRQRDYRWIAATPRGEVAGWEEILDHQAHEGWELVAAVSTATKKEIPAQRPPATDFSFKRPT